MALSKDAKTRHVDRINKGGFWDFSPDPTDYIPLCKSCHFKYDGRDYASLRPVRLGPSARALELERLDRIGGGLRIAVAVRELKRRRRSDVVRLELEASSSPELVDLIAEGFDAAIGGGIDLAPGVVSRTLAPLHIIAVASPSYMKGRTPPADPSGLAALDGIVMRSSHTGRIRERMMRDVAGAEKMAPLEETIVFDDPEAMCRAALLGLGVTLIAVPHALPYLESGALVRLVPQWYSDAGPISIYYATRTQLPAKTRVFVDFVVDAFRSQRLAERFAGSIG
jgi:DNA-binding transcriptional LysR family regulator